MASGSRRISQHSKPITSIGNLCSKCGEDRWILCPKAARPGVETPGSCFRCLSTDFIAVPRVDMATRTTKLATILGLLRAQGEPASRRRQEVLWRMLKEQKDEMLASVKASLELGFDAADDKHASMAFEVAVLVLETIEESFDSAAASPLPLCLRTIEKALKKARKTPGGKLADLNRVGTTRCDSTDSVTDRTCLFMSKFFARIPDGAKLIISSSPSLTPDLVYASSARDFKSCLPETTCANLQTLGTLLQAASDYAAAVGKPATQYFSKETSRDIVSVCLRILSVDFDVRVQRESLRILYLLASIEELRLQLLYECAVRSSFDGLRFVDVARRLLTHREKETRIDILLVLLRTVDLVLTLERNWSKPSGLITDDPGIAASRNALQIDLLRKSDASHKFLLAYIESDVVSCVARCCLDFSEPALMRLALAFLRLANDHLTDSSELLSSLMPPLCALVRPGVARHRRGTEAHKVVCAGLMLLGCVLDKKEAFWKKHADSILDMIDICLSHTGVRSTTNLSNDVDAPAGQQQANGKNPWLANVKAHGASQVRFRAEPRIFDFSSVLLIKMTHELDHVVLARLVGIAMETTKKAFAATMSDEFALEFSLSTATLIASVAPRAAAQQDDRMDTGENSELEDSIPSFSEQKGPVKGSSAAGKSFFPDILSFFVSNLLPCVKKLMDSEKLVTKSAKVLDQVCQVLPLMFDAAKRHLSSKNYEGQRSSASSDELAIMVQKTSACALLLDGGWLPLIFRGWQAMGDAEKHTLQEMLVGCCMEALRSVDMNAGSHGSQLYIRDILEEVIYGGLDQWHLELRSQQGDVDLVTSSQTSSSLAAAKMALFFAHEAARSSGWTTAGSPSMDILDFEELVSLLKSVIGGHLFESKDPAWGSEEFSRMLLFCFAVADTSSERSTASRQRVAFDDKHRNWVLFRTLGGSSHGGFTKNLYSHHAALLVWICSRQGSLDCAMAVLELWITTQMEAPAIMHATRRTKNVLQGIQFPSEVYGLPLFADAFTKFFAVEGDFEVVRKLHASLKEDDRVKGILVGRSEDMALEALENVKKTANSAQGLEKITQSEDGIGALRHLALILSLVIESLASGRASATSATLESQPSVDGESREKTFSEAGNQNVLCMRHVTESLDSSCSPQGTIPDFSQLVQRVDELKWLEPSQTFTEDSHLGEKSEKRWRLACRLVESYVGPLFELLKSSIADAVKSAKDEGESQSEVRRGKMSVAVLCKFLGRIFSFLSSLLEIFANLGGANGGEERRMKESSEIINWDIKAVLAHKHVKRLLALKTKTARLLGTVLAVAPVMYSRGCDDDREILPVQLDKKNLLETLSDLMDDHPDEGPLEAILGLLAAFFRHVVTVEAAGTEHGPVLVALANDDDGDRESMLDSCHVGDQQTDKDVFTSTEINQLVWWLEGLIVSDSPYSPFKCLTEVLAYWKHVDVVAYECYMNSFECGLFMVTSLDKARDIPWKLWSEFLRVYETSPVDLVPAVSAGMKSPFGDISSDVHFGEFVRGLHRRITEGLAEEKLKADGVPANVKGYVEHILEQMKAPELVQRFLKVNRTKAVHGDQ